MIVMWWDGGTGWGMWLVMALGALGFWVLVALAVRAVVLGSSWTGPDNRSSASALSILDQRLARGEIDNSDYHTRRRTIIDGR